VTVKPRQMPDPRPPVPPGATVTTVFEVRVVGDLNEPLRRVIARQLIRAVTQITGREVVVIGRQEVTTPQEETGSS
jgi:hypothetical protein